MAYVEALVFGFRIQLRILLSVDFWLFRFGARVSLQTTSGIQKLDSQAQTRDPA